jgi:eukaryotic-like serine/threonine-protein kinase
MVPTSALMDAEGDPFIGMVVADRFAVLELLGAGSMGTVYRARHVTMKRDVALKIVRSDRLVDPQAKGRFQQEAQATSLLTSPHTVTVFDFGEVEVAGDDPHFIDGSLFLAMELLDGESLGSRLKRVKRVHPREAVQIVRHSLMSLSEAHDKGVIHRDLKPDNLLLMRSDAGEEICKVLDFGIAKVLNEDGGIDALETQAGTVFGTPRYMSPEQAQGKQLDARSDIYSLGVMLYHMVLGRPPFTDNDAVVVMAHHIKTVPKRPNLADPDLGLPADLEDLVMRVLDKEPQRRPQTAGDFLAELDALGPLDLGNASAELTAVVKRPPVSPESRKRALMVAGAALVGLLAAILVVRAESLTLANSNLASAGAGFGVRVMDSVREQVEKTAEQAQRLLEERDAAGAASAEPASSGNLARPPKTNKRSYERFDR